jgi:hypothetical protein
MARLVLALLLVIAPGVMAQESDNLTTLDGYSIPNLMSTFGAYPNPLEPTEKDREGFHPVVVFPTNEDTPVIDLRHSSDGIAPEEDRIKSKKEKSLLKRLQRAVLNISRRLRKKPLIQPRGRWAVGKYDENRVGLYSTEMFEDTETSIDGFAGQRTLHLGVDLNSPVGTKVYAFCDGVVHSAGYNSELGDYGNVVVIQHNIPGGAKPRTVWALYGHMDAGTIRGKRPGTLILKGQVIGRVGDIHGELLGIDILYRLRMLLLLLLLNPLPIISRHPFCELNLSSDSILIRACANPCSNFKKMVDGWPLICIFNCPLILQRLMICLELRR